MPYIRILIIMILAVLVSACNLAVDTTAEPIVTPTDFVSGKPQVSIISPTNGDEFVVDDTVLVSVNASDSRGVTRVQLLANDQIVKTVSSESSNGDPNMNVLLDYKPRAAGTVNLSVVAYRDPRLPETTSRRMAMDDDRLDSWLLNDSAVLEDRISMTLADLVELY